MAKKPEKPKASKIVKINFKSINNLPQGFKKIDTTKIYEDQEKKLNKLIEESEERYKRETEEEKSRIEKLKCPCCKSVKKSPVTITHRDGPLVCGGHNSVQTLANYNVCQNCGVMYVDLNKKEIAYPISKEDRFRFIM